MGGKMRAIWTLSSVELAKWRGLVEANVNKDLPKQRRERNVRRLGRDLSKAEIWRVLMGCQVTTQQRSGPGSLAERFLSSDSPALQLCACRSAPSVQKLIQRECSNAGLRRASLISSNMATILSYLETGGWAVLIEQLAMIESHTTMLKERSVVNFLRGGNFPGLGPKQSRNFIQWLGLSRYEIPLDSRILRMLQSMGANFVPGPSALSDVSVYLFVQEGLQQVAAALGIYPCELDACIFASFDI